MTLRQRLKAALRPALLVGPALGLLAFLALMAVALLFGEPLEGAGGVLAIGSGFALVLGLLIASPLCLVGSVAMLSLSSRNAVWASNGRWTGAGAIGGVLPALPLWSVMLTDPAEEAVGYIMIGAIGAALGALGAWLCRRMLRPAIAELDAVDIGIFA